jgi:hypothetical protein
VSCTGPNAVGADPIQVLIIGNPADAPGKSCSRPSVSRSDYATARPPPGRIKFILDGNGTPTNINRFEGLYATIHGHPSATGAAAVGAVFWAQTSTCGVRFPKVELYSSSGGDPIMFDTAGARLSPFVLRQKPDFVARTAPMIPFWDSRWPRPMSRSAQPYSVVRTLGKYPIFSGHPLPRRMLPAPRPFYGRPTPRAPLRNSSALCRRLPSRSASRATRMTSAGMGSFRWMRHWQV